MAENGRVHKTKGQSKMDNPEKIQDEGAIKDGNPKKRVHKTKGQSKMDNPEKMAA